MNYRGVIQTEILPLANDTGSIRDRFFNLDPLFRQFPVTISRKSLSQKIKYCILLRPVFSKCHYHEQLHIIFSRTNLTGSSSSHSSSSRTLLNVYPSRMPTLECLTFYTITCTISNSVLVKVKVKVKQSRDWPGVPQSVPGR